MVLSDTLKRICTMEQRYAIYWFRQDLRLSDNPALSEAVKEGGVLPIYILDDKNAGEYAMGAASRCWLHKSLASLNKRLEGNLSLYNGDPLPILTQLCTAYDITKVFWNRCYEPWRMRRDENIKRELNKRGIEVKSYNASLLWEPWEIQKNDGTPYQIFTPFYNRGCLNAEHPRKPISSPPNPSFLKDTKFGLSLDDLRLLPKLSWYNNLYNTWDIGEEAAHKRLHTFIENSLADYKEGRNFPARSNVSRLSPYLHFGQISPHQIWEILSGVGANENIECFRRELGWREFSYTMLYFNHGLPKANLQKKFDHFLWRNDPQELLAWQKGITGIPLVDAGIREMWQTGYMHNRARIVVGSFLVKNLLIDWRHGERWFWDCLVDADLANNSASWQWVAGCGVDAAPYFRVFNPITQGQKFDMGGKYVRKYVPELEKLPSQYIFNPWEAPASILADAGIKLGVTYPPPIVDLKISRQRALKAFENLREK